MGCECPGETYKFSRDELLKFELGPAYEDYRDGKVEIRKVWDQGRSLIPDWVDDCCSQAEPDWTTAQLWLEHTIMLVCFLVISCILLAGFVLLRDEQPLKIRDVRAVVTFWLILVFNMVTLVAVGNMYGTINAAVQVLIVFCGPPCVMVYYIVKDLQLWFIYSWQQAKFQQKSFDRLLLFNRFQFVLEFKFFLACLLGVLVVCLAPAVYTLLGRKTFVDANNGFDTIRCRWWHIPEQYQVPTSNSTLCECVRYATMLPGGDYDTCVTAVMNVCINHVDVDPADEGFCEACLFDLADGEIGSACMDWFDAFYAKGSCGHPSRVPDAASCGIGIYSDPPMLAVCAGICYGLLGINFLTLIPLLGKRDEFGLIHENMLSGVIMIVGYLFGFAALFPAQNDSDLLGWYYDDLGADLRASFLFTWISMWWSMVVVLGYPLALFVFKEARMHKGGALAHIRRKLRLTSSATASDTDASSTTDTLQSVVKEKGFLPEKELEQCLKAPKLFAIFGQFGIEAFQAESVKFLEVCGVFLREGAEDREIASVSSAARVLYDTYIQAGSPMEVNIPSTMRDAITKALKELESSLQLSDENLDNAGGEPKEATPASKVVEALFDAYDKAYQEIFRLLAYDAWPRFRKSRFWKEYSDLVKTETRVTSAVLEMVGGANAVLAALQQAEPADSALGDGSSDPNTIKNGKSMFWL